MPVKIPEPPVIPPTQVGPGGGSGGRARTGGGAGAGQTSGGGGATGGSQSNRDQETLLRILATIRNRLDQIVHIDPPIFPSDLDPLFKQTWNQVDRCFKNAAAQLRTREEFVQLYPKLRAAGLTGAMLALKDSSLRFHDERLAEAFNTYPQVILSYPPRLEWWERLAGIARPAFGCMDSILGSFSKVLPILEIPKEYKEQVEASVDALPTLR
jgi:hypothetical protein